jgi:hypothetical protein
MAHIVDTPKPAAEAAIFLPENGDISEQFGLEWNLLEFLVKDWLDSPGKRDPVFFQEKIGEATLRLSEIFASHTGIIIVGSLSGNQDRLAEYEHTTDAGTIYKLPTERITAVVGNAQWYGTGFDVRPVINFRLQIGSDPGDNTWDHKEGMWHQIDLVTANVKFEDSPRG